MDNKAVKAVFAILLTLLTKLRPCLVEDIKFSSNDILYLKVMGNEMAHHFATQSTEIGKAIYKDKIISLLL